jgi:alkylated DNA repair dioxygenase AlkB
MSEADQLNLFAAVAEGPAGLQYWPEFISADDERRLIAMIKDLPLQPFQFGAYEGKRRVVSFGYHYDYSARRLEQAEPIPAWLQVPAAKIEGFRGLAPGLIGHVLCTEYDVGVGIGWHRDKPHFDQVFGLSLGSPCRFRFRRKSGARWQRFTLDAGPRSLYLMTGEARHIWEHSIPGVEQPRYSITFRTMVEDRR